MSKNDLEAQLRSFRKKHGLSEEQLPSLSSGSEQTIQHIAEITEDPYSNPNLVYVSGVYDNALGDNVLHCSSVRVSLDKAEILPKGGTVKLRYVTAYNIIREKPFD